MPFLEYFGYLSDDEYNKRLQTIIKRFPQTYELCRTLASSYKTVQWCKQKLQKLEQRRDMPTFKDNENWSDEEWEKQYDNYKNDLQTWANNCEYTYWAKYLRIAANSRMPLEKAIGVAMRNERMIYLGIVNGWINGRYLLTPLPVLHFDDPK